MSGPSPTAAVLEQEWLVTNGTGSYASGTISGVLTRRYHGLLVAALDPPLGRTLLVAKIDDAIGAAGGFVRLSADRWQDPHSSPIPAPSPPLTGFRLDASVPVWTYAVGQIRLEKRIWMSDGRDTTYVHYTNVSKTEPAQIVGKVLVNYRDFHSTTRSEDWHMDVTAELAGVRIIAFDGAVPFRILCEGATVTRDHTWHRDYALRLESERGLEALDDHLCAAEFTTRLRPGASMTLAASLDPEPDLDGATSLEARMRRDRELLADAGAEDEVTARLVLAADQFVVRRTADGVAGRSIIAGYHWFGDWGRDTMVALPGLTLSTGRHGEAADILRTYARHCDRGMLPNRFPDRGGHPEYNTIDATLWFFEALAAYHEATGDDQLLAEVFPVLTDIVAWHHTGTRFGIRVDPADGLLGGGEPGVQLTWMDAKIGEWVVTPRMGKAVETNALWYNALRIAAHFATLIGVDSGIFAEAADVTSRGFTRLWNEHRGYCYDVIDGPDGSDPALRPNQLFAISLRHSPLTAAKQRAILDECERALLTPLGLRTLGPGEPAYQGSYGGSPAERDGAYHQGTVWPWLIGPYSAAHLRIHDDPAAVRSLLEPLVAHIGEYGIGSIAECADGDPPHAPRGAIAQAWSVAAVLHTWRLVQERSRSPEPASAP